MSLRPLTHIEKWQFFKRDWQEFQKTCEYHRLIKAMELAGIKHPYSENIAYRIYYAGYYREPLIKGN